MYSPGSDSRLWIDLLIAGIAIAAVVVRTTWRRFSVGRLIAGDDAQPDSEAESAIIAFYTAGHLLAKASEGTLDGMRYATYLTTPGMDLTAFVDSMAVINVLDLPFNTTAHLIGLSKEHRIDRVKFENFVRANGMEKVVLEGDFPDYFDIYAATGEQVNVREVLNPKAMAYVVDYCRTHFWEINNAEMYFVASEDDKANDNIFEEAREFVTQIKPALRPGDPGAPVVHHEVPYGEYDGPPLACPVCGQTMITNNLWHVCPKGQGILISGRELAALHKRTIKIEADPAKAAKHGPLTCPNCHNPMMPLDYEGSGIEIDSCEHCPFRWLDADELSRLSSKTQR